MTEPATKAHLTSRRSRLKWLAPVLTVLGAVLPIVGAALGIWGNHIVASKDAKIAVLEERLGSIKRGVGGEQTVLHLEQLIASDGDVQALPVEGYDHYIEDDFYAREDGDGWTSTRMTELEHGAELMGISVEEMPSQLSPMGNLNVNVWRQSANREILDAHGKLIVNGFTFVTLERTSTEALFEAFSGYAGMGDATPDFLDDLKDLSAEDPISFVLQSQLASRLPTSGANFATVVQDIQKTDLGAYVRLTTQFHDVVVDGQPFERYHLVQEIIVLDLGSEIALIGTSVPTPDQRSSDHARVTSLLASLRIVK